MPKIKICELSLWLLIALLLPSAGYTESLEFQRSLYQDALKAFDTGNKELFIKNKQKLKNYPLYPYLLYTELSRNLNKVSAAQIKRFLTRYRHFPFAYNLRGQWLHELKRQGKSKTFIEVFDGRKDTELTCYFLRAKIRAKKTTTIDKDIKQLWLVGKSQPNACDRLFNWFEQQGYLTQELIWNRIHLAMARGNTSLVHYLGKKLKPQANNRINLWVLAEQSPQKAILDPRLNNDNHLARQIILHAVDRLTRDNIDHAASTWNQLKNKYSFSTSKSNRIQRKLALLSAYRHHPKAAQRLASLPISAISRNVKLWRVRTALRNQDWRTLMTTIANLPRKEQRREQWQYWLARALEKTGGEERAQKIFSELAGKRDYYGFLAADHINVAYTLNNQPLVEDYEKALELLNNPQIMRARELYLIGELGYARIEWNRAVRRFNIEKLKLAAALAHQWGWHDQAIRTTAKTKELDDLELRFPIPFQTEVTTIAEKYALPPPLIYSVIRRESAFNHEAISPVGARGLMQLMPATAKATSLWLDLAQPQKKQLFNAQLNIELGTGYLRQMLDKFEGNSVLAAAAYNAGPHRVIRWLPANANLPADIWADTIPFTETRRYVKAVMAFSVIYAHRLGLSVTRLKDRMHDAPVIANLSTAA